MERLHERTFDEIAGVDINLTTVELHGRTTASIERADTLEQLSLCADASRINAIITAYEEAEEALFADEPLAMTG